MFDLPHGRNPNAKKKNFFGLGGDFFMKFVYTFSTKNSESYNLCFDNFLTSLKLMEALREILQSNRNYQRKKLRRLPTYKKK